MVLTKAHRALNTSSPMWSMVSPLYGGCGQITGHWTCRKGERLGVGVGMAAVDALALGTDGITIGGAGSARIFATAA
jgi:hypothetical protein